MANMGSTWVLSAPDGPMLAPWTLLSGNSLIMGIYPAASTQRMFWRLHTQPKNSCSYQFFLSNIVDKTSVEPELMVICVSNFTYFNDNAIVVEIAAQTRTNITNQLKKMLDPHLYTGVRRVSIFSISSINSIILTAKKTDIRDENI